MMPEQSTPPCQPTPPERDENPETPSTPTAQDTEVEATLRRALAQQPNAADIHYELACCLNRQQKLAEAEAEFREAIRLRPDWGEALHNLGALLHGRGKVEEAIALLRRAVALLPNAPNAHNSLGAALATQRKFHEAIDCYRMALRLDPRFALAHNNLGATLRNEGRLEEAEAHFREALRLAPDHAKACNNLALVHAQRGQFDAAFAFYEQTFALSPDYVDGHTNRAYAWLRAGDYLRGCEEYEWRWQAKTVTPRVFRQPPWDGSPLHGKTILLYTEQGLGDTLQFIRYAVLVKERGGRVVLECARKLIPLLRSCPGIDQFVAQGDPLPAFDCHVPLLSLMRIFRTTLETIPARVPYLTADPALCARWRERLEGNHRLKIGIAWQGSPTYADDRHRSLPLLHFAQLAEVPGVRLFSLQKGLGREQLAEAARHFWITDLDAELDVGESAFVDTAAVLKELDLLVTSDTALAHLAGALAVPVWVALPWSADWRWGMDREDSPWYPSMRLFRQRIWGDWDEVFARIAAELHKRVHALPPVPMQSVASRLAERHQRRGTELFQRGQTEEAVSAFREALMLKPERAETHHSLGLALTRQGKLEEAEASFARAVQLNPQAAEVHNHRGLANLALGNLEKAAACFELAVVLKPEAVELQINLGVARMRQGKTAEAIQLYREALRLRPNSAEAHCNLGNALRVAGEFAEAVHCLREAIRLNPRLTEAHKNLSLALREQEKAAARDRPFS